MADVVSSDRPSVSVTYDRSCRSPRPDVGGRRQWVKAQRAIGPLMLDAATLGLGAVPPDL